MRGKAILVTAIAVAAMAFGFASAEAGFKKTSIKGSGHLSEEIHEFKNLRGVVNATWGDIDLQIGDENRLEVTMEDNLHQYLELDVDRGILKIRFRKGIRLKTRKPMTMKLTLGELEKAVLTGSGDMEAEDLVCEDLEITLSGSGDVDFDRLRARTLDATLTGSGDFDMRDVELGRASMLLSGSGDLEMRELKAEACEMRVTGSGDIAASGEVDDLKMTLTGSGDANAGKLRCENAVVKLSGSGDGRLEVTGTLTARLTGSGNFRYHGDPEVNKRVTGSGDLIHR